MLSKRLYEWRLPPPKRPAAGCEALADAAPIGVPGKGKGVGKAHVAIPDDIDQLFRGPPSEAHVVSEWSGSQVAARLRFAAKPAVTTDASALPLAFPDDVDSLFRKGGKERPFAAGSLVVQSRSAASKRITAAHKAAGDVAALAPPVGPKASRCGPTNCALPLRNGAWLWRSVGVGRSDEDEDTLV
eukprot:TRINITY_DN48328_c0_g1_i2.p1 TRINITY_DN48328_c0_g1~~TRINITY_DN48328_c0_g1_i2.p1  ORF type:complete len:186 (-),score=29.63 TRINITY_DN48328_c0_g1_i2:102-659(-)